MKKWKIFVINLAESKERLGACARQLDDAGLAFERIEAVDGKSIKAEELSQLYRFAESDYYKELSPGEIGCCLSHQQVWKKIIEDELDFAVVLEDDFVLQDSASDAIQTLAELDTSWDIIKLGETPIKRRAIHQIPKNDFSLVTYNKVPAGTYAQAISAEGAKKMLAYEGFIQRPIDIDIQYWWERDLKVFGLLPYSILVDRQKLSDIGKNSSQDDARSQAKKSFWKQLTSRLYFLFKNKKERAKRLNQLD